MCSLNIHCSIVDCSKRLETSQMVVSKGVLTKSQRIPHSCQRALGVLGGRGITFSRAIQMPLCHLPPIAVCPCGSPLHCSQFQFPVTVHPESEQVVRVPGWGPWLLTLASPNSGCSGHLGSEPTEERSLSAFLVSLPWVPLIFLLLADGVTACLLLSTCCVPGFGSSPFISQNHSV